METVGYGELFSHSTAPLFAYDKSNCFPDSLKPRRSMIKRKKRNVKTLTEAGILAATVVPVP